MSNESLRCPARRVKESFTKFDYYEESRKYKRRHVMMSRAVNRHMWERSCECDANIKIKVHSMTAEESAVRSTTNNRKQWKTGIHGIPFRTSTKCTGQSIQHAGTRARKVGAQRYVLRVYLTSFRSTIGNPRPCCPVQVPLTQNQMQRHVLRTNTE